jgi:hypothetical protein
MEKKLIEMYGKLYHRGKNKEKVKGPNLYLCGDCIDLRGDCSNLCGNCTGLRGDCSDLRGDFTGLRGDCSSLYGDCTGLKGDLDECCISNEERRKGVDLENLTNNEEK